MMEACIIESHYSLSRSFIAVREKFSRRGRRKRNGARSIDLYHWPLLGYCLWVTYFYGVEQVRWVYKLLGCRTPGVGFYCCLLEAF